MRRVAGHLSRDLEQFAVTALEDKVGPVSMTGGGERDRRLTVALDEHQLDLVLVAMAYATRDRVEALKRTRGVDDVVLVVAERINGPARELIESLGWAYLDASTGELFLRRSGLRIDTTVAARERGSPGERAGIVGHSGRVLSYEILRRHYDGSTDPVRTSTSGTEFGLARSSTSDAMRALKAADLVDSEGSPLLPDLFWALAQLWQPTDRRWLATMPDPNDWKPGTEADMAAWHLGGIGAAVVHGAPVVGADDGPLDLYVPGFTELAVAARRYGVADPLTAAASVAVPTVPQVTRPGDGQPEQLHRGWPVAHPVAAALDLAALDDARSQQILDEWQPSGQAVWNER